MPGSPAYLAVAASLILILFILIGFVVRAAPDGAAKIIAAIAGVMAAIPAVLYALAGR